MERRLVWNTSAKFEEEINGRESEMEQKTETL